MPTRHAEPIITCTAPQHSMENLLRNLPAQHREVILATFFRRRTTGEAALHLGLAPVVVKSRLYEAMRALSLTIATCRSDRAGPAHARSSPRRSDITSADDWHRRP